MLAGWNWIRIVRLVFGGAGLVQGISTHNNVLTVIGALLLIQGIFNVGCCGTSCAQGTLNNQSAQKPMEDVQFEEVR